MSIFQFNKEYFRSVDGILKAIIILLGGICWGLVYIGDVLSTSNNYPEVNDQALLCAATSLPVWILTVLLYGWHTFIKSKSASALSKVDIVFCFLSAAAFATCVAFCAGYYWFIWWCEDSYVVVDVGECPEPEFRNHGQNLAVLVLEGVISLLFVVSAVYSLCIKCRAKRRKGSEDLDDDEIERLKLGA